MNKEIDYSVIDYVIPPDSFERLEDLVPPELARTRYTICFGCPQRDVENNVCTSCGCIIPVKVRHKTFVCPLNKFGEYSEV